MRHIEGLVSKLSNEQLEELVTKAGIKFQRNEFDRDTYESVIDEIDREDFYKLYYIITKQ